MAWSAEQIKNAGIIYRVGKSMGMSDRDIQIGIITAMVESNLINVNYGDRDSLGLFQQRPSQGWGTPSQVLDPRYAAGKFFSALRGLGDRRNHMGMGEAAQAVQRSAYPGRYAERIPAMQALWPRIGDAAGDPPLDMEGNQYSLTHPNTGQNVPNPALQPGEALQEPVNADGLLGTWDSPLSSQGEETLGAWTMPSPEDVARKQSEIEQAAQLSIGPGTNQIIKQMLETKGGYSPGVDGWRKAVVEIARRYLGDPYVWGGTGPGGFDCSGLVQYVFNQVGRNLPRISYQQARSGKRVGLKDLMPGDLVAWDNSTRNNGADHIAIYIGGGQIIEAPRPGLTVRIRGLGSNEGAWGVRM